jgi:Fic family protein
MTIEPNTNMLYIHQFPDWTRFRFDSPKVLNALGQTRLAEGKLIGIMQICGLKDIEAKLVAEDIVANYAIDGYTLDPTNTLAEVELKSKGSQNYIKNYLGAIQNASQPLTEERIFNWHSAMGQNKVLRYRNTPSEVQTTLEEKTLHFVGPNPERLQSEMTNFLSWFENDDMDGVIKAAIAHFWFLTIRPFADANGRLARAITAMQLARTENTTHCQYALNKQINKHKNGYFKILARTQAASGDLTEWILWFLQMMRDAIKDSKELFSAEISRIQFRNAHANDTFSAREQQLIDEIMAGRLAQPFTAKEAAALFNASHDTALREIQGLMDKGVLETNNKGGRSMRYRLISSHP